jgi:hypothetical protein
MKQSIDLLFHLHPFPGKYFLPSPCNTAHTPAARRAPDSTVSFWFRDWSGRAGEMTACTPVPEDFAVRFIRGLFCTGEAVTGLEHENLVDYLPDLYWAAERKPGNGK